MENDLFIKELYQKSLDQKWIIIQEKYNDFLELIEDLNCAFCTDCNLHCKNCKIDKQICDDTGDSGLYRKYIDCFSDLRKVINIIKNKIENKIK